MAHGVLAIRGYVGERAAVRRVIEDRVVAEPSGTGGMRRNLTLDGTSRLEDDAVVFGEGKRADESGGAARRAGAMQGVVQPREFLRVACVHSAEPGRRDAGCALEGVDLEPGVVGHRRQGGGAGVVKRLQSRILGEGGACFLWSGYTAVHVEPHELDWQALEEGANLANLPLVGRGEQQARS